MNQMVQISGFSLIFVAAVLWINGFWLLGKISGKTIVFVNIFVSFIVLSTSIFSIFSSNATIISVSTGAMTLLFSCTYFWLAFNIMQGVEDMVGLGWFSLLIAITLIIMFIIPSGIESSIWYIWNYFNWIIWCLLFFLFFLMIILKRKINKFIGYYSIFAAISTAFLPGFLNLMTSIK